MKEFIKNMKYINYLWYRLGFYVWCGIWKRANFTCDLIDEFEDAHPFCGWLARHKDSLITIGVLAAILGITYWLCSFLSW